MRRFFCHFLWLAMLMFPFQALAEDGLSVLGLQNEELSDVDAKNTRADARRVFEGVGKIFKTRYAEIYYLKDEDIDAFIWRLGGNRMEFLDNFDLASNRVDRIVDRVQMLLDMWPENFRVKIYLHPEELDQNKVAFYEYQTDSLHFSVDYASDGVVAHEIAHAVINQYFPAGAPSKMQEILSQYVDEHLWSEY